MKTTEVIDSYVTAVGRRLPLRRRDDVAYELRGLLADELAERARDAGREPDEAMAVEMLRGYGTPAETAVRYHRPFVLVPAGDTRIFLIAALAGGSVISIAGLSALWLPAWIGAIVVFFAGRSLIQHRRPAAFAWRPRRMPDPDHASRPAGIASIAGLAALVAAYLWPSMLDPRLIYSDSFREVWRMPWLPVLLAALIVVHLIVVVRGHWTDGLRWARTLVTISAAVQIGWHVSYGDVFARPAVDARMLPWLAALSGALMLLAVAQLVLMWARVRPAPAVAPA